MRKLLHRYITASIVGAALVQAIPASAGNTAFGYMFKTKNGKYAFASFDTEKPQTLNQMGAASYGYVHPSDAAPIWLTARFTPTPLKSATLPKSSLKAGPSMTLKPTRYCQARLTMTTTASWT